MVKRPLFCIQCLAVFVTPVQQPLREGTIGGWTRPRCARRRPMRGDGRHAASALDAFRALGSGRQWKGERRRHPASMSPGARARISGRTAGGPRCLRMGPNVPPCPGTICPGSPAWRGGEVGMGNEARSSMSRYRPLADCNPPSPRSSSRTRGPRFTAGALMVGDVFASPCDEPLHQKAWVLASARMSGVGGALVFALWAL